MMVAHSIKAMETLEALMGYMMDATRRERMEFDHLFVRPVGVFYDLPHQRIVGS